MKASLFHIAVSGSRTITDRAYVYDILDEEAAYYIGECGLDLFWHLGGAAGVDSLALDWCRERSQPRKIFFADRKGYQFWEAACTLRPWPKEEEDAEQASDWDLDGPSAGPLRNHRMLQGCDLLIAISQGESPGTRNAINTARQRGVFCHRWGDGATEREELTPFAPRVG